MTDDPCLCDYLCSLPDGYRLVHLGDNSVIGLSRWEATLHAPSDHPDYLFDMKYGLATSATLALQAAIAASPRPVGRRRQTCTDSISPMLREFFAANLQPKPPLVFNIKVRL